MLSNLKLNNDSLLHWRLGAFVGWALWGLVLGIPFHFVFCISSSSIALFFATQLGLQIAVMPWLFAARATAGPRREQTLRRAKVVIVYFTLACEAAFLQILRGNFGDKSAALIFLGGPIVVGSISLIAVYWFQRQSRMKLKEN
jgi:hypothetical protein